MNLISFVRIMAVGLWLVAVMGCELVEEGKMLLTFDKAFDVSTIEARDVEVSQRKSGALRIASFHRQEWPGITLKPVQGSWDLSAYRRLAVEVRNVGTNDVKVCCRVDNPGGDGVRNCVTGSIELKPNEKGTINVSFASDVGYDSSGSEIKLFGMRGYPWGIPSGKTIDPRKVTQIIIFVPKPKADHAFEIGGIGASEGMAVKTADSKPFFPFIDEFGQYIHKDWPGKTHSVQDLIARRGAEADDLAKNAGPDHWNKYGGWQAGPTLRATGHFRAEKYEGKWWLVDPEGKLFFSHGTDCVNTSDDTPLDDRANWFLNLPGPDSEFKEFYRTAGRVVHGYYEGRKPRCFDFAGANLKRKYGEYWKESFADVSHLRLRNWGLNTIANWSDPAIYLAKKTPYVVSISVWSKPLEGSEGYWGKFKDVFDPGFKEALRKRMAQEVGKSANDPWCIGYFVDNELSWGDDVSLAVAALASPPDQAAKAAFANDLKAKYGTIEKLNAAWGAAHASWEELLTHRQPPDRKKAHDDLVAFYAKTAELYFKTCREAVKEAAPDNLYLGCRFAWVNDRAAAVAARYCDVVSYNLYRYSVADFQFPGGADVPLIIGEFHFGALDRGLFHTGLKEVKDQDERAKTYRDYVQGVLRHPSFVGCHWFKYRDESTTGRPLDGENYQIGFLDIADTPYPETVAACREVGRGMYRYRISAR